MSAPRFALFQRARAALGGGQCGLQRGAIGVEAAWALPVVIVAGMAFMELADLGLTVNMGASALDRAVQQFRQDGVSAMLASSDLEGVLRLRMAAASHRYLAPEDITDIQIEAFESLDAMGKAGQLSSGGSSSSGGSGSGSARNNTHKATPVWRFSVGIRKEFITPLPQMLGVSGRAFRYEYQQVLAYLPVIEKDEETQP